MSDVTNSPITVSRGGWKLLEDTLRSYAEGRTTAQFVKLCTLWDRVRGANKFFYEVNGEKIPDSEYQDWLNSTFPNAQDSGKDIPERLRHNGSFNRLWNKWVEEDLEIQLTPKQYDLAREFLKKRMKEGKDAKPAEPNKGPAVQPLPVSTHSLKLLLAFKLDEDPVD